MHRDLPDFGANAEAALRKIKAILDEHEALRGRPVKFLALDNLLLMSGQLTNSSCTRFRLLVYGPAQRGNQRPLLLGGFILPEDFEKASVQGSSAVR